jgi:uncharacterized membrane protein YeaQ/YmgE (transglycosylase-associated protein family)
MYNQGGRYSPDCCDRQIFERSGYFNQGGTMGILFWIVFGGIAGWLASIITKRNDQMGCLTNIVVGVLGALIGGWVASFFGFSGISGFNLPSLLFAVLGAVVLLLILGFFQRR